MVQVPNVNCQLNVNNVNHNSVANITFKKNIILQLVTEICVFAIFTKIVATEVC